MHWTTVSNVAFIVAWTPVYLYSLYASLIYLYVEKKIFDRKCSGTRREATPARRHSYPLPVVAKNISRPVARRRGDTTRARTRVSYTPLPPRDSLATSARTRPVGGVFRVVWFFSLPAPPRPVPSLACRSSARPPNRRRTLCPHTCDGFSPVSSPRRRIHVPFFRARPMFGAPASVRPASVVRGHRCRPPAACLSVILRDTARGARGLSLRVYNTAATAVTRGVFSSPPRSAVPQSPSPCPSGPVVPGAAACVFPQRPSSGRYRRRRRCCWVDEMRHVFYYYIVRARNSKDVSAARPRAKTAYWTRWFSVLQNIKYVHIKRFRFLQNHRLHFVVNFWIRSDEKINWVFEFEWKCQRANSKREICSINLYVRRKKRNIGGTSDCCSELVGLL